MIAFRSAVRIWISTLGVAACGAAPAQTPPSAPPPVGPTLFAPGVISGPPTFRPDGTTAYFTRKRAIVVSRRHGDRWTEPEVAPFSGRWGDSDPAMAPDGSFLIFVSNRPAVEPGAVLDGEWGAPARTLHPGLGGNLWRVDRQGDGWGPPSRLPDTVNRGTAVMEPCIVADGSLYFMDAHLPGNFRFYRSRYQGGAYQAPEQLPFSDGVSSDWDLTIAPDQSFLVFASDRPPVIASHGDDLFIAFRNGDAWGPVTHLGPEINNTETGSIKPRLGPDHHTLYFMSDRAAPPPRPADATPPTFRIWRVDLTPTLRGHLAS